jgi:hypothetical protein
MAKTILGKKKQLCTDKIGTDHVMNHCGGKLHYLIRREAFTVAERNSNVLQKMHICRAVMGMCSTRMSMIIKDD